MTTARFLIGHGLWILGAAILLAAFSYFDWRARSAERPRREILQESPGWRRSLGIGWLLIASGFLVLDKIWWHQLPWAVVWLFASTLLWRRA